MSSNIHSPLSRLRIIQHTDSPTKNIIKISKGRLPVDFFNDSQNQTTPFSSRNRHATKTGSWQRPSLELPKKIDRRQSATARDSREDKDTNLIMDVIETSRNIKRVLRKHSLELKRAEKHSNEREFQLPSILWKKSTFMPQTPQ